MGRSTARLRSGQSRCRGFSLIEALIAILIVASGVLAMMGVISYGFNETQVNATQVQAIAIGQQNLDALRSAAQSGGTLPGATTAPIDQGDSFLSGSQNAASGAFNITPNTCPQIAAGTGGSANEHDCSVTVTWTEDGQNESIKIETYVTY
jgi:Tfp pilus assembly protein PilV